MARKPRENLEGGAYHVYARGNAREDVYRDDIDLRLYLRFLRKTSLAMGWRCLAYCLMTNHLHLLVETPRANLSRGMQSLHGRYAGTFNARHGRTGHVFEGRFGAKRLTSTGQLCAVAVYIARNPVDAGLCGRPEEWPWSSFGAAVDSNAPEWLDHDRLLSHFGSVRESAAGLYVELAIGANLNGV